MASMAAPNDQPAAQIMVAANAARPAKGGIREVLKAMIKVTSADARRRTPGALNASPSITPDWTHKKMMRDDS